MIYVGITVTHAVHVKFSNKHHSETLVHLNCINPLTLTRSVMC